MKKDRNIPEITLTIEKQSHEGKGIGHIDGRVTFIEGALPGETVKVKPYKYSSKFIEANLLEVINPSEKRIPAICEHAAICGGCSLQHISANDQITLKQAMLIDHLKNFGNTEPKTLLPALLGPTTHYRYKARLSVRYVRKKDQVLVGFHEKHSRFIAAIRYCHVLEKGVAGLILPLQELIRSLSNYQQIPQIEIAVGENQQTFILRHLEDFTADDHQKLSDFAKLHNVILLSQRKGIQSIVAIYPQIDDLRLHYRLPKHDLDIFFAPWQFSQVNPLLNQNMVEHALALLDLQPHETVLDLYCGIGNFTLPLAKHCQHVVGVEGCKEAVQQAQDNARRNHIENAEFHVADLNSESYDQPWAQRHYDKVLLDPSRAGAKEIMQYLAKIKPQRIVYISCNSASLARDAGILVNHYNYKLRAAGIMDMFPHTAHVEAIALFEPYNSTMLGKIR